MIVEGIIIKAENRRLAEQHLSRDIGVERVESFFRDEQGHHPAAAEELKCPFDK